MSSNVFLVLAVFLACTVEMVEATTIVLAVGTTRGWRSGLLGVGAGLVALAVLIAALGPALVSIPLNILRIAVGGLLLVFGLGWLRKAILRASGWKSLHDEDAIFAAQREQARLAGRPEGFDAYGFTLCFKGVFLEGLEVAFIVLTFGGNQKNIPLAAVGAAAAVVFVLVLAVVVRGPLSRVPENTLKYAVGVLLVSFGTFWGAEGAGVRWPGADAALAAIIPLYLLVSLGLVSQLRSRRATPPTRPATTAVAGVR